MEIISGIDWYKIFMLDTPLLETFVRGTVMYLTLFFLLRIMKRQAGEVNMSDLLVIVLIADAAQNGMAGEYTSIGDGIILVVTLVFWDFVIDWASYHVPWIDRLTCPPPVPLIVKGKMLRKNMRKELITEDELTSQLRLQGIDDITTVKRACMEGSGKVSIIEYKRKTRKNPPESKI